MRVLDVGSGGRPHGSATVLCDALMENLERGSALIRDGRPFVLADIQHLPFRSGAFDYLFAVHVLEHARDPEKALSELIRVAKRGYVETPSPLAERLYGWPNHRCTVRLRGDRLLFGPKVEPQKVVDLHLAYRTFLPWKVIHRFLDVMTNSLYVRVEFSNEGAERNLTSLGRRQAIREILTPSRSGGVGPEPRDPRGDSLKSQ